MPKTVINWRAKSHERNSMAMCAYARKYDHRPASHWKNIEGLQINIAKIARRMAKLEEPARYGDTSSVIQLAKLGKLLDRQVARLNRLCENKSTLS